MKRAMKMVWLHPDCLAAEWCALGERAVFIFDDAYLTQAGWGLKRVMFVYETLLELPVEIHRGPTVATLLRLAGEASLVTVDTPDPWLRERFAELGRQAELEIVPAPAFVEISGKVDLQRFSRYWRRAEGKLLA